MQAWLAETRGCWDPLARNSSQSYFLVLSSNTPGSEEWDALKHKHGLHNHTLLPKAIAKPLRSLYEKLLVCPSVGALFLVVLLWATLIISTPLSSALRYGIYFLLLIPVLAAMGWFGAGREGRA